MGLDVGDRRIGVALSDPQGILATPLSVIERRDEVADVAAISEIVRRNGVERVIVGLPRSMEGNIGTQAEKVTAFTEALVKGLSVPVEFRDERLSTVAARRLMREAGKKMRGVRDDAMAAAVILQSYLEEDSQSDEPPSLEA